MKQCNAPNCDRQWVARGLCLKHYVDARRKGTWATLPRVRASYTVAMPNCSMAGCPDFMYSKGLCYRHYCSSRRKHKNLASITAQEQKGGT